MKYERWSDFQSIKITVNWRTIWLKIGKSQKVKRTKGQVVTLAVFLERHPGILPDHAQSRAEDAVRLLPHYHWVACNKYFVLYHYHIISCHHHINYNFKMCTKHFFIVSSAIIAPWGFSCLCFCRICRLSTRKILPIVIRLWKDLTYWILYAISSLNFLLASFLESREKNNHPASNRNIPPAIASNYQ